MKFCVHLQSHPDHKQTTHTMSNANTQQQLTRVEDEGKKIKSEDLSALNNALSDPKTIGLLQSTGKASKERRTEIKRAREAGKGSGMIPVPPTEMDS